MNMPVEINGKDYLD